LLLLGTSHGASAQAVEDARQEWHPPTQVTGTYMFTLDDYSFQSESGSIQRIRLNGAGLEYASRKLYPWEAVVSAQYSTGHPLGQHLLTIEAGPGYCRGYRGVVPFVRALAGIARTSSSDSMYLYKGPKSDLAIGVSGGIDWQVNPRLGVRLFQVQNQYLPFGSEGSVYWSVGAGVTYYLRPFTHRKG
jgi:hypothetical protein